MMHATGLSSSRTLMKTLRRGAPAFVRSREESPGREHALVEGAREGVADPHHLPGRPHLRAEDRVDTGELVEREHALLDRDVTRDLDVVDAEVVERPPRHHLR